MCVEMKKIYKFLLKYIYSIMFQRNAVVPDFNTCFFYYFYFLQCFLIE